MPMSAPVPVLRSWGPSRSSSSPCCSPVYRCSSGPFACCGGRSGGGRKSKPLVKRLDRDRIRRPGAPHHREAHGRRQDAELLEARREGRLQPPALDLSRPSPRWRGRRSPPAPTPANTTSSISSTAIPAPTCRGSPRPRSDRSTGSSRSANCEFRWPNPSIRQPPQIEAVVDHPRRAQYLEHHHPGAHHLPARQILRRPTRGHVHPRPARHPGHLPALHHPPGRRGVPGGRAALRTQSERLQEQLRRHHPGTGEHLLRGQPADGAAAVDRPRPRRGKARSSRSAAKPSNSSRANSATGSSSPSRPSPA